MRSTLTILLLGIVFVSTNVTFAQAPGKVEVKVATDRPDAIYKCGEDAQFTVQVLHDGQPAQASFQWQISLDGDKSLGQGESMTGTFIPGTLKEPGILRLTVTVRSEGQKAVTASAAAAFDPLEIRASLPVPDDFDEFWTSQKQKLARVPLSARQSPVKSPGADVECFDVQIDCGGDQPVSGYFARPVRAQPGSLPAVLYVHGAGVRSSQLQSAYGEARRGRLALDINAHGIPNGQSSEFYEELNQGRLKGYRHAGRESRDTCYFLGMFVRLMRAMDFLCAQPEWDGEILIVRGGSQGGGQALAAAGLDARVTAIYAGVPALCDHSGNAVGRVAGWPKLVPRRDDGQPDPAILGVARYFDGMNFATRTRADAIVSVGLIDSTCPPTTVYAAYNGLGGEKKLIVGPLSGHEGPPGAGPVIDEFLNAHIARRKAAKTPGAALLKTFVDEFVSVTPGEGVFPASFEMGSADQPNQQPIHKVTLADPFAMARYEVPQNLYESVMGTNPSRWKGPRNSVEMMSWNDATRFCEKMTAQLREAGLIHADEVIRLPTEAEWEYCCRAGTRTRYSFGDLAQRPEEVGKYDVTLARPGEHKIVMIRTVREITGLGLKEARDLVESTPKRLKAAVSADEAARIKAQVTEAGGLCIVRESRQLDQFAWHHGNAAGNDPPVGALQPNAWGLFDMHGYLWEFTADGWSEDFARAPMDGSAVPAKDRIVLRGGSWKDGDDGVTSTSRRSYTVTDADDAVGFRCVRSKVRQP